MANLSTINLDGKDLTITDTTARSTANEAVAGANNALQQAMTAQVDAKNAKSIAIKKAYITYTESSATMTIIQNAE